MLYSKGMDKRMIGLLFGIIVFLALGTGLFITSKRTSSPPSEKTGETEKVKLPSPTLKGYTDSSGFTLNYPDNLSLLNSDTKDNNTYADIQLSAKDVLGKMHIRIIDSKYSSVSQFFQENASSSAKLKDVKLGTLAASQIQAKDRVLLAALDKGVLFTVEVLPEAQEDYWANVYSTILTSFSFNPQSQSTATSGGGDNSDAVSFEGEETVE